MDRMPPDVNMKQIDAIMRCPELQLYARQLISLQIISGDHRIKRMIADQVNELLIDRVETSHADRLKDYSTAFFRHLSDACGAVSEKMKEDADAPAEVVQAAGYAVINEVMLSIDKYFELITRDTRRKYSKAWVQKYLNAFKETHSNIELPDLARRRSVPYSKLFVSPDLAALDDDTLLPKMRTGKVGQEPVRGSLAELQKSFDRMVILGDPGAGKSTVSTIIGVEATDEDDALPFIITLRSVDAPKFSLPELLATMLKSHYQIANVSPDSLEEVLHERRTLLIFDGLDEILVNAQRVEFTRTIESIAGTYAFARIVVTCRRVGYPIAKLDGTLFSAYQIGHFSDTQIARYARKWFDLQEQWQGWSPKEFVSEFLRSSRGMLDVVRNPLLLAFVCVLYRGRRAIPRSRYSLYKKCVELLLGEWDQARGIIDEAPDSDDLQTALARIAHVFGRKDVTSRKILDDLVPYLADNVVGSRSEASRYAKNLLALCRGRAWLFTDVGVDENHDDIFAFTHSSFYEYFLALYTVRSAGSSAELSDHLYSSITTGQSEVFTQICLALHQAGTEGGASEVLVHSIERFEREQAARIEASTSRPRTDEHQANEVARSVAAKSIVELADTTPLSRDALTQIAKLSLAQIAKGDCFPALTVLSDAYRHKIAMHEVIAEDLAGSARSLDEIEDLRFVWFALHAGYLRLAGFDESSVPVEYIVELRESIGHLRPAMRRVSGVGVFERALSFYAGAADEESIADERPELTFTWAFEQHWQPVYGLGPKSLTTWVFDAFQSDDRRSMNVAGAAKFLRAIGRQTEEIGELPIGVALPRTAVDPHTFAERVRLCLPRIMAYPEAVRSGFAYVSMMALSMTSLGDPLATVEAEAALMGLPLHDRGAAIRHSWHSESTEIWLPPEGTVAS
jgi:hypothetical protein